MNTRTGASGGHEPEVPVTQSLVVWGGGFTWSPLTSPSCLPLLQPQDDYSVLFEDTSYADGYSPPLNVAQRYVVACKEPKKK